MTRIPSRLAILCTLAVAGVGTALGQLGPDVVVADLIDTRHYTRINNVHAYAVGTTSCNIGDMNLRWESWNRFHPVIGQNMFRLKDGRFEQIGLSWLKHGFITIDAGICPGPCQGTGTFLGPGCADPYHAGLNGQRSLLGPRYQVNAATGFFVYPYDDSAPIVNGLSRRLQVHDNDLNPALNAGALYFVEGQYVTADDAAWGNNANNQSYRRVRVGTTSSRLLTFQGSTQQQLPAIHAWKDHGLGANTPDPELGMVAVDVPDDGRFWVGSKATENKDGSWHYEIAVQNLTSDRSGGSVSIVLPPGATAWDVGFKDIHYHSGEPWDGTDWDSSVEANTVSWTTAQTFDTNPFANALRWGTLYNYWFDSEAPPTKGNVTIGLFKPGDVGSVVAKGFVPVTSSIIKGDMNCDGAVDGADIDAFFLALGFPADWQLAYPGCNILNGDMTLDDALDGADIDPFFDCLGFGNCP